MSDPTPPDENEPGPERPASEQPTTPSPGPERPASEQPTTPQPGPERPASEQPTTPSPGPEGPGPEQPAAQQPGEGPGPGPERPAAAQPTAEAPPPRRLYRSRGDRVIGGVCGGIAKYFNVDPVLVRVGAVALVFLGGAGLLAYIAAVLLIPNEGDGGRPADGPSRGMVIAGAILLVVAVCVVLPFQGGWGPGWGLVPLGFIALAGLLVWRLASGQRPEGDASAVLRAMALGVALLAACFGLAIGAAWASAAGGDGVVAGIVIAAGLALIAGAFVGDWARWLILPALAVALPAGVVAAADVDVHGGYGEKTYRPASAESVRDSYQVGVGHLVVDLRDAQLPPGDHHLKLRVGVGEADLIVSPDVCVSTDSHVGIGGVQVFERTGGGIDSDWQDENIAREGKARIVLDGDVGIGAVTVHHRGIERWETEPGNGACT